MEREKLEKLTEVGILDAQSKFLERVGLWTTPDLKEKYAYRLSPDCLKLSNKEKKDLEEIANLIYAPGGFLDGSLKLFQKTLSPQFTGVATGGIVRRGLTAGIAKREIPIQEILSEQKPFIVRLDLVKLKRKNESDPSFQIVEVEGDKTHGFGYLSIMDYFREEFVGRKDTRGIVWALEEELTKRNIKKGEPIILIVGQNERFYLTELEIFSKFAQRTGINLCTALEDQIKVGKDSIFAGEKDTEPRVLVNIPVLTSTGYSASGINEERLFELYQQGKIVCLIPPKRFLGSKGLLGLVRNGDNDPEIESVLNSVFNPELLLKIKKYIPETILVTRRNKKLVEKLLTEEPNAWVVKQTMSSGTKGVSLPDDPEKRKKFLEQALSIPFNYVIQKKIPQETRVFSFSEAESPTLVKKAKMFMRVELFACPSGIATVGVTARETPSVHAQEDAIQIPVIFAEKR